MTEQTLSDSTAKIGNSPLPLPAGGSSPAAMVFHDPLSGAQPEEPTEHSHRDLEASGRPFTSNRFGVRRLKKRRLATRADAIEAVARELQLLAQRRGKP